jgi:nitrite reductase/ring-hydroxylating ferredoxin subunit
MWHMCRSHQWHLMRWVHAILSLFGERMPTLTVDGVTCNAPKNIARGVFMDAPNQEFALAGSLEELKAKGRLVVHGPHRPILVIHDRGRVFALDNHCPHMGFPLERGSVEDGILTCHWHHARFDPRKRLHLRLVG